MQDDKIELDDVRAEELPLFLWTRLLLRASAKRTPNPLRDDCACLIQDGELLLAMI
jgi:hypothetical protein